MIVSHSRIECFEGCPYRYDLKYNQGIKTIPPDNADNALFLGTALHTGLEKGVEAAVHEYFMSYPVITDAHINEAMKLEYIIPKAKALIPDDGEFEVKIEDDDFIGFIDLLVPSRTEQKLNGEHQILPNVYDLYDFKYSNNVTTIALIQIFLGKEQSRKGDQKSLFPVCSQSEHQAKENRRSVSVQKKNSG